MEIKDVVELMGVLKQPKSKPKTPFIVGKKYFIRTVTLYYTGELMEIYGNWLILKNASWIADTGRFHDFLKEGVCNEYESFLEPVYIPVGSIVDVSEWKHPLFSGQK